MKFISTLVVIAIAAVGIATALAEPAPICALVCDCVGEQFFLKVFTNGRADLWQ